MRQTTKAILSGDVALKSEVTVTGWVRSNRDSKSGISFLDINDGSSFDGVQVIVPSDLANYESDVLKISTGCAVKVTGILVESEGKGQKVEIKAIEVDVCGWIDEPESYPIAKKRHSFEYLRTVAHLRPRTNTFGAITRVRTVLANAIHNFYFERGFNWINTPIITGNDCEGAGELFRVSTLDMVNLPYGDNQQVNFSEDFFASETYLTVSGQLQLEALCLAMSRVYTFGPTFRAENSNTSRHLAEFWMVEPEIAFADLSDLADLAEDMLTDVLRRVLDACEDDIAFFAQRIDKEVVNRLRSVLDSPYARMDFNEAIKQLENADIYFEFPVEWGLDLQSEHERWLTETHVGRPVVVMNYPKEIKAFYMRSNDDEKTVAAMDVLAPGIGEIIGGSQREERLDQLDTRMDTEMREQLWWYRDLRRYGTVPHAGFGLGFARLLTYITGMENIRDAIPFPRTPGNALF